MSTAYDRWLTSDPSDDGSDEAIQSISDELALDADEVENALGFRELPLSVIAQAFVAGTDEAWAKVRAACEEIALDGLKDRAVDVLNERREEALIAAAESRAERWAA